MKNGRVQCKDVPDAPVLEFLSRLDGSATRFWTNDHRPPNSVMNAMPAGTPERVALSKMGMLIRRGLVDGCDCGCRGDFTLTEKGRDYLLRRCHNAV